MDIQDDATSNFYNNKVSYRFISDPAHKENLSGRVRAACLTCRRKKIKCDGEVPCQTCKEKGVLCEGLTKRKRPSRTGDRQKAADAMSLSQHIDSTTAGRRKSTLDTSHARGGTALGVTSAPKRPETLIRIDTVGSDSSLSSGQQSRRSECAENIDPHCQVLSSSIGTYEDQMDTSPFNVGNLNWVAPMTQDLPDYDGSKMLTSEYPFPTQLSEKISEWSGAGTGIAWSPDNYAHQDASQLISAAKVLEAHAQSLRWLASGQQAQNLNDARRQTVNIPLQSDVYTDYSGTPTDPKGAFDDIALAMGHIPSAPDQVFDSPCDCTSWPECGHWKPSGIPGAGYVPQVDGGGEAGTRLGRSSYEGPQR